MGIDLLDLSFRVDRQFGVDPRGEPLRRLALQHDPPDVTVGELHELICRLCAEGVSVPDESWSQLRRILADMLAIEPDDIQEGSWLVQDLGME